MGKAVKARKTLPSTAVQMPGGELQQPGGRTRHAAGKDDDGPGNGHNVVSGKWERKWAKSATRRHSAEQSGKLEMTRAKLAAQGKKMRESNKV